MVKQNMQKDCPASVPKSTAVLPNYKLVINGWSRQWRGGTASLQRFTGGKVPGAVYEVTEECLRKLDRLQPGYERLNVTVFDEDGTPTGAATHVHAGQLQQSQPSSDYAAAMRQGYKEWGIA